MILSKPAVILSAHVYARAVGILLFTHPLFLEHDAGPGHPEHPARLQAVADGIRAAGVHEAVVPVVPPPAARIELERIHESSYLDALERFCRQGGGQIDMDTHVGPSSWDAAVLGAGGGLEAVRRLGKGEADAAFLAVRPPGHHATSVRAQGFCLLNNVAVTAATLADQGERVLIMDWDAHHGNGTQRAFYHDPRVVYVSMHQYPFYPGTGNLTDTGSGAGAGTTVNFPLPAGATGDVFLAAIDEVVAPLAATLDITWLLVSAGFDAHWADPLAGLALTAGDYADLTRRVLALAPPGRLVLFLEGGYDLDALAASVGACVGALCGVDYRPEPASSGGPGREIVETVARRHDHEREERMETNG